MINILNPDGTLNDNAGAYKGLTMKKARAQVVADLEAQGLLERVEDREIDLAHSDRSKTPIEPYLADQWFVKMSDHDDGRKGLAQSAMDAVIERTRADFSAAVCQELSRLARREARLAGEPAALVGAPDTGVAYVRLTCIKKKKVR